MNGAEALVRTLLAGGVEVCFTNPGTSEMHFVAALDRIAEMRCVLGLAEGVVAGAADGYARMAGKPAATLLHLGPGLGNALANLHNAGKARSPVVNIVGEHATYHIQYNTPLTSDIAGIARPVSAWVGTATDAATIGEEGMAAIAAARAAPGQVATLILPADAAWGDGGVVGTLPEIVAPEAVAEDAIEQAAAMLREPGALLLLGADTLFAEPLDLAGDIAAATGCGLLAEGMNKRLQRGAGRVAIDRIPYPVDQALKLLAPYRRIIMVGARHPAAFFAYPDTPSLVTPLGCEVFALADAEQDCRGALHMLAEALEVTPDAAARQEPARPDTPTGAISPESIAQAIAALLPEQAIVVDESVTTGRHFLPATAGAPPHDWLQNRGGAIGLGLPMATGAAIACPDRKVVCLESDGCAMYNLPALWTQAREGCDVTTLIFSNRAYNILKGELAKVGAGNHPGPRANDMLTLDRPDLGWTQLAVGMGVEAERVDDAETLSGALARGLASDKPYLIEVVL
ncbi:MAG: acetolactate synthase large subunit [Alphaproteobacteria bacterium]|mgnify:CR=1 FL=1|jgi:acetolactate synthase-1/2/3 large subunit|nr:acetolactate synthase large subunit [Alphaproteobacteria bacterium]MDP6236994.1 acetolactate synthase large subunit [Alphaproteobacteria bacterium]MDP7172044.1 acetolactate synthase large subunit [Alphaproteobacteria bacterium]MDP7234598.1 acetolactate synthase large subunit [Alphaproteobacteria bacterium]MDP7487448.1 acetolactate synthase large subunit [Alphaproteobacteria bacterium]|tara:strand:+ start:11124 stop:12668 length:1545 start_codon:yes stop_codon:yes gene_type:complete